MIPTIYTREQINNYYVTHNDIKHDDRQSEESDVFTVGYHYGNDYTTFGKRKVSTMKTLVVVRHRKLHDGRVLQRCTLRELDVDYHPETDVTSWMEIDVPRSMLVTEDPQEALALYNQMIENDAESDVF